jgi:hypothetical protein
MQTNIQPTKSAIISLKNELFYFFLFSLILKVTGSLSVITIINVPYSSYLFAQGLLPWHLELHSNFCFKHEQRLLWHFPLQLQLQRTKP